MAAAARLAGLVSVGLAVALALATSPEPTGTVAMLGWATVALLIVGLVLGHEGGVVALALGFTLRLGLMGALGYPIQPDLWVQVVLLTLAIEVASISYALRVRPVDPIVSTVTAVGTALIAGGLVEVMEILVFSTDTNGVLVRTAGIAAMVIAAGWVIRTWRRSGIA